MNLFRLISIAALVVGVIFVAIGMIRYFAYAPNDERQLAIITCIVGEVKEIDEVVELTVNYEYQGKAYTMTERNAAFAELGFQKGQVLELWVNPQNPEEILLPALKPQVQAWGVRYMGMGIALIVGAMVLWKIGLRKSALGSRR